MKSGHSHDLGPAGPGHPGHRGRPCRPAPRPPFRLLPPAIVLAAAMTLTSCGPTAEQVEARQSASGAASAPAAPRPRPAPPIPEEAAPPAPEPPSTPEPLRVGVSGTQAGMPAPVQEACQFLLRRDAAVMPAAEAGACVRAGMTAGGGGTQTLTTASSWLPQGDHTVEFTTAPDFSLTLDNRELDLRITAGTGGGSVDTGGGRVTADPEGTPEEAYAAVLSSAAELTVNPEKVAALLGGSTGLDVDYDAVLGGAARTRISGIRAAGADDMMPTGITLWLDEYYRPVRFELTGQTRGISSAITAVNTAWSPQR